MPDAEFDARMERYLEFAKARPDLFANPPNGIRILLDPAEIATVEKAVASDLEARNLPPEGAHAGIVHRDPWFYLVRDAVEFADGSRRMHARIINRIDNGTAVLPVLGNKIVLVRHFRHPLRRAILEIPRGGVEAGRSPEDTAREEIREEIGGVIRRLEPVGFLFGSTNIYGNGAHLFFADLESVGAPQVGEGVTAVELFTVAEFEALLRGGEILDSFTVAAYVHSKLRRLI